VSFTGIGNPQHCRATGSDLNDAFILQAIDAAYRRAMSLQVVKQQCVVDVGMTADDNLLTGLIIAARQLCGRRCNAVFSTAPCFWYATSSHIQISVPLWVVIAHFRSFSILGTVEHQASKPGCVSVTSITYIDQTGLRKTLDPSTYTVDVYSEPARIFPVNMIFWPWIFNTYVRLVSSDVGCRYITATV